MQLKRCNNGHLFDVDLGPNCPFCADDRSALKPASEKLRFSPADVFASVSLPVGLEDYCVNELLGQGSTGTVYKISKTVQYAVKVISWDCSWRHEHALREYRTGVLFSGCPNTIHLLNYFEQNQTSFIQQELAEPLLHYYRKCRPTVGDVLHAALDICAALTAIHEKGYQHYDVKPSNLFIVDGTIKLGDFSHCSPFTLGTPYRHVIGTYQFAAPEIVSGGPCSGKEDIYSFGVCLYMLLSGKHPFPLQGRVPPVRKQEDRLNTLFLHPDLIAVIEKATAYDPQNRYATIDQVAATIRSLADRFGDLLLEPIPFAYMDNSETLTPPSQFMKTNDTLQPFAPHTFVGEDTYAEHGEKKTYSECSTNFSVLLGDDIYTSIALPPNEAEAKIKPPGPPVVDDVQFTVIAEKTVQQSDSRIIEIAMYKPEQKQQALAEIQEEFDEQTLQKSSHPLQVEQGSLITVSLSASDIEFLDDHVTYRWTGRNLRFSFGYFIPPDYSRRQIMFRANVFFDGVIATSLLFTVNVDKPDSDVAFTRQDVHSAFLSYAREDIEAVTYIIQTLKKIRPDLDIFFDLETLRSGEDWEQRLYSEIRKRDRLFLCWSRAAASSKWVDREWRCMADAKGVEAIEPFPLESPDQCPVPEPLGKLCFDDLEVLIRRAKMQLLINSP